MPNARAVSSQCELCQTVVPIADDGKYRCRRCRAIYYFDESDARVYQRRPIPFALLSGVFFVVTLALVGLYDREAEQVVKVTLWFSLLFYLLEAGVNGRVMNILNRTQGMFFICLAQPDLTKTYRVIAYLYLLFFGGLWVAMGLIIYYTLLMANYHFTFNFDHFDFLR